MGLSFMNVTPAGEFGIAPNYKKYLKTSHQNKGMFISSAVLLTR
jgi:hypothetical protein